jgi:hypothetical protein
MLYVDTPTSREFGDLNQVRSDACVSIYRHTTPLTREIRKSRINLGNLVKNAISQLEAAGFDKRRIWPLQEQFDHLLVDDAFWLRQARSLAILATPAAATQPVESLFRSLSAIPALPETISGSPDRLSDAELASAARPVLDVHYKNVIASFHRSFEQRASQNRTTTDVSDAARAATFGGVEYLLVDIDTVVDGFVDEETGAVTFNTKGDAANYGVVDEIARRALCSGARILGVRREEIPDGKELAAILRYPM